MQSEQLLTKDLPGLEPEEDDLVDAIRFPFQRFSDHLIVQGLLDAHLDPEDLLAGFAVDQPLHDLIAHGKAGAARGARDSTPER